MPDSTRFFSDTQRELAGLVLDRIVPPTDRMPGGGEIAIGFLDAFVASSPQRKRLFNGGFTDIESVASARYSADFGALNGEQRDEVLRKVEANHPAFFDQLVRQTYNGYYTNPRVVQLIGLENRPPQPMGYRLEVGDLTPTETVKRRGIAYREVE